ncbi:MAG TPA: hypothetical protein VG652_04320 [Gaiellaceae bacterium]|nr:hypothetical protein [Gaiellaceae bacterium]
MTDDHIRADAALDVTDEYPTVASGELTLPELGAEELGDGNDEWPVRGPASGIRLARPTAALAIVLLVAAGFWGGAIAEKDHGSSSSSPAASLASRFRSAGAGSTGAGAAPGGFAGGGFRGGGFAGGAGGGGTAAATGTVSVVDGNTLYVLTSAGALVKVTLGQSTTVTRNAKTAADDLRPGDSVVVQGAAAKNGDVTATSIAATGSGVSSGTGG